MFIMDFTGYSKLRYKASCTENTTWYLCNERDNTIKSWTGTSIDIEYDISALEGWYIFKDGCANNERSGNIYNIQLIQ